MAERIGYRTMKRNFKIGCILLCAALVTGCSGRDDSKRVQDADVKETAPAESVDNGGNKEGTDNRGNGEEIGIAKAKEIALNDAKLKEKDVQFTKEGQDTEDGRKVYDIEFYHGEKEYDYEIDAVSGNIISHDYEIKNQKELSGEDTKGNGSAITLEEAKKIALKKAGLKEKDGTWKKEKEDQDDGRMTYELEFVSGEMEYEFEIDAETGNILDFEKEPVYN